MTGDERAAVVAEALAAHEVRWDPTIRPSARCTCGSPIVFARLTEDAVEDAHRAHQAAAVVDALDAQPGDAEQAGGCDGECEAMLRRFPPTDGQRAGIEAAIALVSTRPARAAAAPGAALHRDLVSRLGFGDNITEPMADNDTIVEWFEEQGRHASEWTEHELWRDDCYAAGHPDDEDCDEHGPTCCNRSHVVAPGADAARGPT